MTETRTIGWQGKKVRHADGRIGIIATESLMFGGIGLNIEVDNGGTAYVCLNVIGKDAGEPGWEWWCENFSLGARYLPLGDDR